jgi:exopolysaccharide biosynthesis polyprenyl glycosylphosphotransferase
LFLGDAAICVAAFFITPLARNLALVPGEFYLQAAESFLPIFAIWFGVFYIGGLYDFRAMRKLVDLLRMSLTAFGINTALATAYFYVSAPYFQMTPKSQLLLLSLLAHAGMAFWRQSWVRIACAQLLVQRVAFLGENAVVRGMVQDLRAKRVPGYVVVRAPALSSMHVEESMEHWNPKAWNESWIRSATDILVIEQDILHSNQKRFRELFSLALAAHIPVMTELDFYEMLYDRIPPQYAADPRWLLNHGMSNSMELYPLFKRFIDLAGATAGLLLISPFLLLIAAMSSLLQGGTPLYSQKRVGYLGREFRIWKFRTMLQDADKRGPLWRSPRRDARVTRWGEFLRRTHVDELPQLWNVILGDMSLVGPRPEWVQEVSRLEKEVPYYHLRHLRRPGMTGWAQVRYRATNSPAESHEKLHFDLFYIKNVSFALDAGILLKTMRRMLG